MIQLFSNRSKLRAFNKSIELATFNIDVALVEELMEEKNRFLESLY